MMTASLSDFTKLEEITNSNSGTENQVKELELIKALTL